MEELYICVYTSVFVCVCRCGWILSYVVDAENENGPV